uniref:Uncharacterized protein n=1 Tax=uncultured marine virus TaxID=186617 RepID=A0A0F7L834_9VIRU|nr:hypothetical protein [uncultured marine virus]
MPMCSRSSLRADTRARSPCARATPRTRASVAPMASRSRLSSSGGSGSAGRQGLDPSAFFCFSFGIRLR